MVDGTRIGQLAAEVMELAEAEAAAIDGTPTIGVVAVVFELDVQVEDGPGSTYVSYRCSDGRRWVQLGLFEAAKRAVLEPDDD